jgi:transposase
MIEPIVGCCAGLDVHKAVVVCTLLKEDISGEIRKETREYRTFRCELRKLAEWLKEKEAELTVMESTGIYWKSVFDELEKAELKVYVVNARHAKNVPGRKTDVQDSEWLAELGRCGLLRPSFIPPADLRELRMLTRYRRKLGGYLAGEKNRLHKVLDSCGIRLGCVVSSIDGVSATKMIEALIEGSESPEDIANLALGRLRAKKPEIKLALDGELSDRHKFLLDRMLRHIRWLEDQIREIESQVVTAMKPYREEWQLIQTVPGFDMIGAAMLLAEIGPDMKRFGHKNRLSSWAGICPGNNESAGKKKHSRIRQGNRYVRQILCEAAHSAVKSKCQFRGIFQGLVIRRGKKRAIVAVGHKMLKVIYVMLSKKEPYKDPGINYEKLSVERNAPRWIKALKKYGYLPVSE